jgi:oxygen-dependent protoporphyrinogen oxidase
MPYGKGHVVVVGAGIAGLAAAYFLSRDGAQVTVLESSGRFGGKVYADELAGVPVDLGAESMLARRPEAVELAKAVGLGDELTSPATTGATLWSRGRLRAMPAGHVMGVPGDLDALAASGVISPDGLARIPLDLTLPPAEIGPDVAVGDYVAGRLGREVVDRLVEPLLGGVYAGDAYRISLRAAVPQLFPIARSGGSLVEGVQELQRRAAGAQQGGPVFAGIPGGIGRLPLAVAEHCRDAGVVIETGSAVRELRRVEGGWRLVTDGDRVLDADAVVLATPAMASARLLATEAPVASAELSAVEYADMAIITMAFRQADVAALPEGSGFLVPPVERRVIKAATFSSRKWAWAGEGELFVLRTSIGRHGDTAELAKDDDDLVRLARRDLEEMAGLGASPVATRVTRWTDGLPQYAVGHVDRVARIREHVGKLPGLAVCGAVFDGVGIPACISSARAAATSVSTGLRP